MRFTKSKVRQSCAPGSYSYRRSYRMNERSYSSSRRLKTWLRSRMGDERFSSLTVLNGRKQSTDSVHLTSHWSLLLARKTRETLATSKSSKLRWFIFTLLDGIPRGVTWVNFCWVCAAGLSEPLPHYSLFCGQL